MMKRGIRTGRPKFHIRAQYITYEGPEGIEKYQLDSKGKLSKNDLFNPVKIHQGEGSTFPLVKNEKIEEPKFDDFEIQGFYLENPLNFLNCNNETFCDSFAIDENNFDNYQFNNFYDNYPFQYGDGL